MNRYIPRKGSKFLAYNLDEQAYDKYDPQTCIKVRKDKRFITARDSNCKERVFKVERTRKKGIILRENYMVEPIEGEKNDLLT